MASAKVIDILVARHRQQFVGMGLPEALHRLTCEKVVHQIFDGGRFFQFQEFDEDIDDDDAFCCKLLNDSIPKLTIYDLVAIQSTSAEANVFLIDHMWYVKNR